MRFLSQSGLFLTLLSLGTGDYNDRECGKDLGNLWLDIVILVDNSIGMDGGITEVGANIVTLFGNGTRIGTNYDDPRNTRIGIVTYNSAASVVADLNQIQSIDDLYQVVFTDLVTTSTSSDSFLIKGIGAAEKLFQDGGADGYRENYMRIVVIYASSYQANGPNDPVPAATRLKSSGVIISTVAFDQNGDEALIYNLGEIASPGLNFTSKDPLLIRKIQNAFLQTNCVCKGLWNIYSAYNEEGKFQKYGVCVRAAVIDSGWTAAKFACQNLARGGYLATEFSSQKHNFILGLVTMNDTLFRIPYTYHIGLSYVNQNWYWQQGENMLLVPLGQYTHWAPGNPKNDYKTATGVACQQYEVQSNDTVWVNESPSVGQYYICEVAACDTDTYCSSLR